MANKSIKSLISVLLPGAGLLLGLMVAEPVSCQDSAPQRVGIGKVQKNLTLAEAVELALAGNLDIQIERSYTNVAKQAIKAAQGGFDPTFRWLPSLESRNLPASSVLQGSGGKASDHLLGQNFYFREKLPWAGTSLSLDFENSRQSTTNPFASLNPYFNSRLFVSFNQPLLRNRDLDRPRAELRIRRKESDLADAGFELRVTDIITQVEQAFWTLVAVRQDAQVSADTVNWAKEQLAQNQRMIAAGLLPPVEASASKAELERRMDTWYSSIGAVTEAENLLKALLSPNRETELWNEEILPAEESTREPSESNDLAQAVDTALKQRPEIQQARLRQQTNSIQKQLNASQVKPQLDLVAAYGNTGLGGTLSTTVNPFTSSNALLFDRLNQLSAISGLPPLQPPSFGSLPDFLIGGYGTAFSNVFSGRYQTLQVGMALDLNLRNRTAQANLAQSLIAEKRLQMEESRVEQVVEVQVRNALQALQTSRQRISAAEASVQAAQEKLESEQRLFQSGESTNFLVLTRQNELADSRRRQVAARADFNRAVARLEQSIGTTLEAHNVKLK